jgi:Flp pilus assembly protein TadD
VKALKRTAASPAIRMRAAGIPAAAVIVIVLAAGCASSGGGGGETPAPEARDSAAGAEAEAARVIDEARILDEAGSVGAALDMLTGWDGPPEVRSLCLEAAAGISIRHGQPSMAVLSLERAIEARPDDPLLIMKKGEALMAAGRESEAEVALRECLAIDWSLDRAKILMAELLFQAGRLDNAAAFVDAVSADHTLDARALIVKGAIRHESGRTDEALKLFARAALADSTLADPYFNRGCVFEQTGSLDLAEQAYRESLRRDGDHVPSLFNLGRLLVETDRREEGRGLLDAACSLEKDPVRKKSMHKTSTRLLQKE